MSLFLAQILPDPRSPHARDDLRDAYALHRRVMSLFPDRGEPTPDARRHFGVLFRPEVIPDPFGLGQRMSILVQSHVPPALDRLPPGYAPEPPRHKPLNLILSAGQTLRFRLRANPSKRLARGSKDHAGNPVAPGAVGKRVDLRDADAQAHWLARKGRGAFSLVELAPTLRRADGSSPPVYDLAESGPDDVTGRKDDHLIAIRGTTFEGLLRVDDPDALARCVADGIGPGKAFGFGLLSLARP